nr:immunoglobulin light chain junction region [Macaca mulatta]
CQQYISSPFTF